MYYYDGFDLLMWYYENVKDFHFDDKDFERMCVEEINERMNREYDEYTDFGSNNALRDYLFLNGIDFWDLNEFKEKIDEFLTDFTRYGISWFGVKIKESLEDIYELLEK